MVNKNRKIAIVTLNPRLKLVLDILPLVVFFLGFKWLGIFAATGALIAVTIATLIIMYIAERRIALSPLITGVVVGVFGGLTLYLHNDTFIKIKPTLINFTFATILLIGCMRGKGLLKPVLGAAFVLSDRGWFILSRRWGVYFICLGLLNEYVWRNYPTDIWVDFKVFGLLGLTMLFALAQTPFIQKHQVGEE